MKVVAVIPSHCEGSRDDSMSMYIRGSHVAADTSWYLAGSRRIRTMIKMKDMKSARDGGMSCSTWNQF